MKHAQKLDHVSLKNLVGYLRDGRYVIPDFQREFEWKPSDIRELMRSIFLDYYIGSLLLWKGKSENFRSLSCQPVFGYSGTDKREYIVLDGQQRLTALYYAFLAPDLALPNRTNSIFFYISIDLFMEEKYDEAFGYEQKTKRWVNVLSNPKLQYHEHLFPLSMMGSSGREIARWFQGYESYWGEKRDSLDREGDINGARIAESNISNAKLFDKHLEDISDQYQISYIELDKDLEVSKVCDIFTQINSRGIRLDIFDLMNALLKPKELQLKHLWWDAASRLKGVESEKMNVYILQVMSILLQSYCSPKYLYFLLPGQEKLVRDPDGTRRKEILIQGVTEFEKLWNVAVDSLEDAIKLLKHPQEFGAIRTSFLPYISILPVFAALRAHIKSLPANRKLDASRKLRYWYWASVFTNRYSGSVESTSARDFLDLKAWFDDDKQEPSLIAEFAQRFRNLELRKETKRGTSVYNGIFNLLVLQGARDWMTDVVPQFDDLDDHHIIPSSWCKEHLKGTIGNSILNRAPLTSDTNRNVIRDRIPNEYLPDLIKQNSESAVRAILESHFISPAAFDILLRNPFSSDDFEAFITERQRTLQSAIENLLIKERLDLAPQLRELDAGIEKIELSLRRLIDSGLNSDVTKVPQHVAKKVDDRIKTALKKNASLEGEKFETLIGQLEFFDLREIQDTLTAKSTWLAFEKRFSSKEALNTKFEQLAELRNGIRHSRTVSSVVQKEGEAAIEWFESVLLKEA